MNKSEQFRLLTLWLGKLSSRAPTERSSFELEFFSGIFRFFFSALNCKPPQTAKIRFRGAPSLPREGPSSLNKPNLALLGSLQWRASESCSSETNRAADSAECSQHRFAELPGPVIHLVKENRLYPMRSIKWGLLPQALFGRTLRPHSPCRNARANVRADCQTVFSK